MTTIYVAGGSSERLTVCRPLIAAVQALGYEVTYDWTTYVGWDRTCTDKELVDAAEVDEEAVRRADIFWYALPQEKSEGAATEFGIALGLGKLTLVSGPMVLGRVFPRRAVHVFAAHDTVLEWLARPFAEWCLRNDWFP